MASSEQSQDREDPGHQKLMFLPPLRCYHTTITAVILVPNTSPKSRGKFFSFFNSLTGSLNHSLLIPITLVSLQRSGCHPPHPLTSERWLVG